MTADRNISPEIEAALAEGREIGLREAAALVAGLRQRFVPYFLRGLGDIPETDIDGWGDLKGAEKKLMEAAARAIIRLVDGYAAPAHEHIWSDGDSKICAVCGLAPPPPS